MNDTVTTTLEFLISSSRVLLYAFYSSYKARQIVACAFKMHILRLPHLLITSPSYEHRLRHGFSYNVLPLLVLFLSFSSHFPSIRKINFVRKISGAKFRAELTSFEGANEREINVSCFNWLWNCSGKSLPLWSTKKLYRQDIWSCLLKKSSIKRTLLTVDVHRASFFRNYKLPVLFTRDYDSIPYACM